MNTPMIWLFYFHKVEKEDYDDHKENRTKALITELPEQDLGI